MPYGQNGHELSIAQLEKMLDDRRSKLESLEKKRAKLARRLDSIDAQINGLGGAARARGGRVRNKMSLNDSIVAVLKKAGGNMKVADIVHGVLRGGYNTRSPNFRGIVNQALIKDKRFAKTGIRGSYLLKK